MKFNLYKAYP